MQKRNIINHIVNAVIFVLMEAAALSILCYNGPLQGTWFGSAGQAIRSVLWGWTDDVGNYFALNKRNDSLAVENVRLMQRISSLEKVIEDSVMTSSAYLSNIQGDYTFIPAQIKKISNNTQHNYIIIDKGAAEAVEEGDGIITEKGAIGVIDAVSEHFSYAKSFRNHNTSISARIRRTGPTGTMKWDGKSTNKAILMEIPHHIEVSVGDTVFTSGYSSIFPADIPLGVVESTRMVNGASHKIKVNLFEEFNALRYVTIVKNNNLKEISILENEL